MFNNQHLHKNINVTGINVIEIIYPLVNINI